MTQREGSSLPVAVLFECVVTAVSNVDVINLHTHTEAAEQTPFHLTFICPSLLSYLPSSVQLRLVASAPPPFPSYASCSSCVFYPPHIVAFYFPFIQIIFCLYLKPPTHIPPLLPVVILPPVSLFTSFFASLPPSP